MEELLRWRIQKLQEEIITLRKEKVWVYAEMDIVRKEINSGNSKYNEILEINKTLIKENNTITSNSKELDIKIANTYQKESNILISINKHKKSLLTLDLSVDSINNDIVNLNKDKSSLVSRISELNTEVLSKNKSLEIININITKSKNELEKLTEKIDKMKDKELYLTTKDNELLIKESRLDKREVRLNDFKLELLSKK